MDIRKLSLAIIAPVVVAAAVGCGGGDKVDSEESAATPENVKSAGQLAMVRAHETVSLDLYRKGNAKQASKHAGHPTEEIFFSLSRSLRSKDAALTAQLRQALKKPNDLIVDGAPPVQVKNAYTMAWETLDRAEARLVPGKVRRTDAFRARVIGDLLEKVEEEYGEAVEGGQLKKEIEYQDAWGALEEAKRRFEAERESLGQEAESIEEQLDALDKALPSIVPPEPLVSPQHVEDAVDAAIAELNEAVGVRTVEANPVAELGEVSDLLEKAMTAYARGERAEAQELAAKAYLDHFEKAEPALAARDKTLMENLEVLIATKLRREIKAGGPKARVDSLARQALRQLDKAEGVLKKGK